MTLIVNNDNEEFDLKSSSDEKCNWKSFSEESDLNMNEINRNKN
jgi:hypothetical protein